MHQNKRAKNTDQWNLAYTELLLRLMWIKSILNTLTDVETQLQHPHLLCLHGGNLSRSERQIRMLYDHIQQCA